MDSIREIVYNLMDRFNPMYEMANVSSKDTKLPYDIWIDSAGSSRNIKHNMPRIKVLVNGKRIPVSIEDEPRILIKRNTKFSKFDEVSDWVKSYKDILIQHWNNELTDKEVLNQLGPTKKSNKIYHNICTICGKDFEADAPHTTYCSDNCRNN